MATLGLSEDIVDAVIAKLNAGVATRIAAINAAKADAFVLENPDAIYPFGLPGELARAPAYVVTPFGESPAYEGDGPHGFIYAETVAVMIVEEDPDREAVGRKLLRQRRAVIECLWDDAPKEALTNSAFTLQPSRHIVGPTLDPTNDQSFWRSYFIQLFTCKTAEGD